jgi:hypothetical protein
MGWEFGEIFKGINQMHKTGKNCTKFVIQSGPTKAKIWDNWHLTN